MMFNPCFFVLFWGFFLFGFVCVFLKSRVHIILTDPASNL